MRRSVLPWVGRTLLALAVIAEVASCSTSAAPPQHGRSYPVHTHIVSTTFWVGEIFDPTLPDGSQICSTYDSQWALHWSGVKGRTLPQSASGCAGSISGGCDGAGNAAGTVCATEKRTAGNDYFPQDGSRPRENPFYLDLPYDDLNDPSGFARRCAIIPWSQDAGFAGHCSDHDFSYLKNRWVSVTGASGRTCFGQIEDAGPSHGNLYHDAHYVFGNDDARPAQSHFNNAGMDVSPALNGCLGYRELNGESDRVSWRFVDDADVPDGPWKNVVTSSGVTG